MSFVINEKLNAMEAYSPVSGDYRIRLDANESFISPDEDVMNDIIKGIEALRFCRYPDPLAQELCTLAAAHYNVSPDEITAGNGSDELIGVIISAFTQKGDSVLTFNPDFSMYSFYCGLVECPCLSLEKSEDYRIDIDEAIKTANDNNVRIIIFSNPCNPTSIAVESKEIIRLIKSVSALVVLDEAYMEFYGDSLASAVGEYDNLIVLRTFSKAMGLAAVRLGFALANRVLTAQLQKAKSPYNVNSVSQLIGVAVLNHPESIKRAVARINESRDNLLSEFKRLQKLYPAYLTVIGADANFVFLKTEFAGELFEYLKESGIVVRCFGDKLRVTAGRNWENNELIKFIEEFYSKK